MNAQLKLDCILSTSKHGDVLGSCFKYVGIVIFFLYHSAAISSCDYKATSKRDRDQNNRGKVDEQQAQ